MRARGVREVDADERAEPLKAEARHGDEACVDRNRVVGHRSDKLDGVDDGKAKALGKGGVDEVVPRAGVDEGARGWGLTGRTRAGSSFARRARTRPTRRSRSTSRTKGSTAQIVSPDTAPRAASLPSSIGA